MGLIFDRIGSEDIALGRRRFALNLVSIDVVGELPSVTGRPISLIDNQSKWGVTV